MSRYLKLTVFKNLLWSLLPLTAFGFDDAGFYLKFDLWQSGLKPSFEVKEKNSYGVFKFGYKPLSKEFRFKAKLKGGLSVGYNSGRGFVFKKIKALKLWKNLFQNTESRKDFSENPRKVYSFFCNSERGCLFQNFTDGFEIDLKEPLKNFSAVFYLRGDCKRAKLLKVFDIFGEPFAEISLKGNSLNVKAGQNAKSLKIGKLSTLAVVYTGKLLRIYAGGKNLSAPLGKNWEGATAARLEVLGRNGQACKERVKRFALYPRALGPEEIFLLTAEGF